MNTPDPFVHDERTDRELLRELWRVVSHELVPQVRATNGRVGKLEKFQWTIVGGLTVVSAIVVPLFIRMVME